MKRLIYILFLAALSFLATSCEEGFQLDDDVYPVDGIAFNGLITNENPPYFFHLTKPALISEADETY